MNTLVLSIPVIEMVKIEFNLVSVDLSAWLVTSKKCYLSNFSILDLAVIARLH